MRGAARSGKHATAAVEVERRKEFRYATSRTVQIAVGEPPEFYVAGEIVDESAHGMRIRHHMLIQPGQKVTVIDGETLIVATVVWSRRLFALSESGFKKTS